MLKKIDFRLELFRDDADVPRSRKALLWLMQSLIQVNLGYIREYAPPPLYQTRVVYRPEKGTERWRDIPTVLKAGYGDCEDLACWRCAELLAIGVKAAPYLKWRKEQGRFHIYHAVVKLPDGLIEDPSRSLGMRGHPTIRRPVYVGPGPMPEDG